MASETINKEKPTSLNPSEEANEASEMNQPSNNATEKDIDDVLMVLNEINQISGGKGSISNIPNELHSPIKFLIEKMVTIRDAFEDPLFKDVLDDMDEQRQSGQVPSLLVAIARNVPMEELTKIADDENYEDVQNAVNDRVSKEKSDSEAEKALYSNFDKSKKAIDAYCAKMSYDDARKQKLYARIAKLRDIFADGLVTEPEVAEIDKIDNYDTDMEAMKARVPENAVKTVLPDKASIEESMVAKKPQAPAPQSSLGGMTLGQPDYMNTGKRKIFNKK